MNCEQARAQIGAWVDGELEPAAVAELETHLATCAACRGEAESLRRLHAELVRTFATPRAAAARAAEWTIASLPPTASVAAVTATYSPRWPNVFSLALAMACGFLLAVLIFRPWKAPMIAPHGVVMSPNPDVENVPSATNAAPLDPSIARLVVTTRSNGVECIGRDRKDWKPVAEIAKFQCPADGGVRTDDKARRELVTSDGCVVRMNSGTEIVVH